MTDHQKNKLSTSAWQRLPVVSVALVVLAAMLMPFHGLALWLQYDRVAVDSGQLWRLLTCQLTHWSWDHLLWDAAALLFLGWVLEKENFRRYLTCLGLSTLLIPVVVHVSLPDLATYRGLSGIDSAVFVLLAVCLLQKCRADGDRLWTWACAAMLVGFVGKIGFELLSGGTLFVDAEASLMVPVPAAHVAGGILGAGCGWLDRWGDLKTWGTFSTPLARIGRAPHSP